MLHWRGDIIRITLLARWFVIIGGLLGQLCLICVSRNCCPCYIPYWLLAVTAFLSFRVTIHVKWVNLVSKRQSISLIREEPESEPLITPVSESGAFNLNINGGRATLCSTIIQGTGERRAHELTRSISTFSRRDHPPDTPSLPIARPDDLSRSARYWCCESSCQTISVTTRHPPFVCTLTLPGPRLLFLRSSLPSSPFCPLSRENGAGGRRVFQHCLNTILSFTN